MNIGWGAIVPLADNQIYLENNKIYHNKLRSQWPKFYCASYGATSRLLDHQSLPNSDMKKISGHQKWPFFEHYLFYSKWPQKFMATWIHLTYSSTICISRIFKILPVQEDQRPVQHQEKWKMPNAAILNHKTEKNFLKDQCVSFCSSFEWIRSRSSTTTLEPSKADLSFSRTLI